MKRSVVALVFCLLVGPSVSQAQVGTAFTYQGRLTDAGAPANGVFDLELKLFDALSGGAQVGSTVTLGDISVANGLFTVTPDFGAAAFTGNKRWLEIGVRPGISLGAYTPLSSRQELTPTPNAIFSSSAAAVTGIVPVANGGTGSATLNFVDLSTSQSVGGSKTFSSNLLVTGTLSASAMSQNGNNVCDASGNCGVPGIVPIASGGTGSATQNFVDLTTAQTVGGNKTLTGNLVLGSSTATTGNILKNANPFIHNSGPSGTFIGENAGNLSITGALNTGVGSNALANHTTGTSNTAIGADALGVNTTGHNNTATGSGALRFNTTASHNTATGQGALRGNTTGYSNTASGVQALYANTIGTSNTAHGAQTLLSNTTGGSNAASGAGALANSTTGSNNTAIGAVALGSNTTGDFNTAIGWAADAGSGDLSNATAIGASALVSQSNSLVLGSNVNVGIGTSAPNFKLHVVGENLRVEGNNASVLPRFSLNFTGGGVDQKKWQMYATTGTLSFTALNDAESAETGWLQVNRGVGTSISGVAIPNGNVAIGIASTPDKLGVNGTMSLATLGSAGATALCRNASNQISTCSSSARYKSNIDSFTAGLSLIEQLHPVSFNWRDGGMADMGLVAEEVSAVEPLLTTTNASGQVEGVKYDRVAVVLVNAIKEQQAQLEEQERRNGAQRTRIDALEKRNLAQQTQIERLMKIVCAPRVNLDGCAAANRPE